jgi:hypothetical protein
VLYFLFLNVALPLSNLAEVGRLSFGNWLAIGILLVVGSGDRFILITSRRLSVSTPVVSSKVSPSTSTTLTLIALPLNSSVLIHLLIYVREVIALTYGFVDE